MTTDPHTNGVVVPATFDGTVFRPTAPVTLPPDTEVVLFVEPAAAAEKTDELSFLDTANSIEVEGPTDWATNLKAYLYGRPDDRSE